MTLQKIILGKKNSIWRTTAFLMDKLQIPKLSHKVRMKLISWSLPLCALLPHCSSILHCKYCIVVLEVPNMMKKKISPHISDTATLRHCHTFLNGPSWPSHIKSKSILYTRPTFPGMQLLCACVKGDIVLQGSKTTLSSPSAGTSSSVTTLVTEGDWTSPGYSALLWNSHVSWYCPQSGFRAWQR